MSKHLFFFAVLLLMTNCTSKQISADSYAEAINKHRKQYKSEFTKSPHSPLSKQDLKNLDFFAADAKYACDCTVEILQDQKPFQMKTYSDQEKPYVRYASVNCELGSEHINLVVYKSISLMSMPQYKDHVFLPFMDSTNGDTTYGGGRYLDLDAKDFESGETIIIDFNKSYNPYCAYSDGYNCPIPPPENHLEVAINAGEKMYKGKKNHRK